MISISSMQLSAATPGAAEAGAFVTKFNDIILFPLITLLIGIALLYFIYGSVVYIMNAENSTARETGRSHIIYSIIGMFVMLAAYGILTIAANTFGLNKVLDCSNNPLEPGCDEVMKIPNFVPDPVSPNPIERPDSFTPNPREVPDTTTPFQSGAR